MARIAVKDRKTIREIGRRIAEAVGDPVARKALKRDPESVLVAAGVAPSELLGREIIVHEDTVMTLNLIVPNELDASRVEDPAYLEQLGRSALYSCRVPFPEEETVESTPAAEAQVLPLRRVV